MIETYFIENRDVYGQLNKILSDRLPSPFEIKRTENGKPYLEGDPLFFCISHSGDKALIAVCDSPVGVDMEVIAPRNYRAVLARMFPDEQNEIKDVKTFLRHWVVREAYIKMLGETLAAKLKGLKFTDGVLYDGVRAAECEITHGEKDGYVYCVCVDKRGKVLV